LLPTMPLAPTMSAVFAMMTFLLGVGGR
jgi:hypothetical protein